MADYYQSIKNTVLQNKKRSLLIVLILFVIICLVAVFVRITRSKTANTQETELLIYPSDNIETIKDKLKQEGVIKQGDISFTAFADILKYSDNIKTGHYIIKPNTTMINLVRKLRTGKQQPVRLVINNARTADDFAKKITEKLMITPQDLTAEFDKKKMDYPNDIFLYIIPDTYEVFWNTGADNLCDRLWKESSKFWEKNKEKLKLTGLTKKEVIILASIVDEETNNKEEMPVIAGVYINRLRKGMLLQADPTVKFAVGDFSLRRITSRHLHVQSPFNTYKYKGLPPAPICLPDKDAINAVLKYKKHDYLYFCAKEDFSGSHNFASTHEQHSINANKYRQALNVRGIK